MNDKQYKRQVQTSVTNFIFHGDEYLFLKRNENKRIDPGRLNGIGGRVEPGEDYLSAAIRETVEETGYVISTDDIQFCGVVKLEGGYKEDWVMCFFKIKVADKKIPHGNMTEDGKLMWIQKDAVLDSKFELVDDLYYCFKDVVVGDSIFFVNAKLGDDEKIYDIKISKLNC